MTADLGEIRHPLVSVVSLCFNTGRFVIEALDSLRRQTYRALDVLVVDDGSTDGSDELVSSWITTKAVPYRFVRNATNRGIPGAFNRALPLLHGEYVTWIADDIWEEDRVAKVVDAFLRLPPWVAVLFGDAVLIDAENRETGLLAPARTLAVLGHPGADDLNVPLGQVRILPATQVNEALFWRSFIPTPTVTVRRALYDAIGPYDESLAIEDLDCWFRAARAFDFAYLRSPLVRYRVHSSNFSSGLSDRYLRDLDKILRRWSHETPCATTASAVRRHVREEAFRVIGRLAAAGRRDLALHVLVRYYLPRLSPSWIVAKETYRAVVRILGGRAL